MAYCAKCGNQIGDSAGFCTKCGTARMGAGSMPAPKKHLLRNIMLGAVGVVVGLGILGALVGDDKKTASGTDASSASPPSAPDVTVDAPQLFADYQANGVAADEKYKGKILEISGNVDKIDKDITDTIYVTLSNGDEFQIFNVQLFFSDAYKAETARLQKGDFLRARCRCDGKFAEVLLKDCVIEAGPAHAQN
jgi:hypothetical protein